MHISLLVFIPLYKPTSHTQNYNSKPNYNSSYSSAQSSYIITTGPGYLAGHMELLYDIVDHDLDQTTYENDGDDMFYAELERRILVLINTADEISDHSKNPRMTRRINNYSSRRDQSYFDWTETENPPSSVPSTILNLWRSANGNGTGVFIPHMVKAKRRNKNRGRKVRKEREIYKANAVANMN